MSEGNAQGGVSASITKRVVWIDICRVLCMFSIVYGHSAMLLTPEGHTPWTGLIMSWFWDSCAPCVVVLMFFFLSGWLQKRKCGFLDVKKFLFLAIPVVVWNAVQLVVEKGTHAWRLDDITCLGLWPTFTNADKSLWFLDELAWFSLFLPLIHRIPVSIRCVLVFACAVTLYALNPHGEIIWEPRLKFAADCLFFLSGTLLAGLERARITDIIHKLAPWVFILSTCYIWRGIFFVHLPGIPTYTVIYALVGLVCLLCYGALLERCLPRLSKCIAQMAPAVFFIYAAHWPIFTLWGSVENHFGLARLNGYAFPLYTVVCFALCILIWYYAQKLLPARLLEWVFLCKKPKAKEAP